MDAKRVVTVLLEVTAVLDEGGDVARAQGALLRMAAGIFGGERGTPPPVGEQVAGIGRVRWNFGATLEDAAPPAAVVEPEGPRVAIADDAAAIAARLAELEAERRGGAPVIVGLDVARPGSDVTVVMERLGSDPGFVMVDERSEVDAEVWSAFEASRPRIVAPMSEMLSLKRKPQSRDYVLARRDEALWNDLQRLAGPMTDAALGEYEASKAAWAAAPLADSLVPPWWKGGSGVQPYAAKWSTRPMAREEAVVKYPPAQPLSPFYDWSKGG